MRCRLALVGTLAFATAMSCPAALAVSGPPAQRVRHLLHDVWQSDAGLPENSVPAIQQTPDGYLWLATGEGLARFDGVRFEIFTPGNTPAMDSPDSRALALDHTGTLWIGTAKGRLVLYRDRRFSPGPVLPGTVTARITAIVEAPDHTMWVAVDGAGLFGIEGPTVRRITRADGLPSDAVRTLHIGRDGSLWAGTRDGLSHITQGRVTSYTVRDGLSHNYVTSIIETRAGELLVGTNGGGINRQTGQRFERYMAAAGLPSDTVLALLEDHEGALWVGTNGAGLCRSDGARFDCYGQNDGLTSGLVWTLALDREGSLWAGTIGGGLHRFRAGPFMTFTEADGLSGPIILPVYQDAAGAIWVGTAGAGLNRLADGRVDVFSTRNGLPHNVVLALAGDRLGHLWIGTAGGGLTRFDGRRFTTLTTRDGLPSNLVHAILEGRDGTLWVGTNGGGVGRLRGGRFTTIAAADGLASNVVTVLHESRDGTLWVGTDAHGISRIRGDTVVIDEVSRGLAGAGILGFHEDEGGAMWVGTADRGLVRVKDGRVVAIQKKDGLFDRVAAWILDDGRGDFWMTSNKGVYRVAIGQLNAFADGRVRSVTATAYGTTDGMKSAECNGGFQPAGWKSTDGRLWFPTSRGLSVVDPARLAAVGPAPAVILESVTVNGGSLDPGRGAALTADTHNFDVRFTAPSFVAPSRLQFRYRLVGFDGDWVDAGNRRTAYYTNLPSGSFRFEVAARHRGGPWNSTPATFDVSVPSRFYQTWWFFGLWVVGGVALGLGVSRWRITHLQRREHALLATIEERRRSGEALQRSEQALREFKTVFDTADFGAVIADIDGVLTYVNDCYAAAHGYKAAELIGQAMHRLHNAEQWQQMARMLEQLTRDGSFNAQEVGHCRRDGTTFPMLMTGTLARGANGTPLCITATAIDLTERKALEEQVQQAQKMESVGRLAGGVAHDFNNMLGVILGHTEFALGQVGPAHPLHADLEEIRKAATRSADLTRQLLAFARRQTVAPKVLDLNETVAGMLKMLDRLIGEGVQLRWRPGAGLWPVRVDPSQIDQILANLCVNARDAIARVGTVTIETGNCSCDASVPTAYPGLMPGDYVGLVVTDDGCGMDSGTATRIFEPFFTTKPSGAGTGLGLSTVYGIVKQNSGFVDVDSEPGVGTTFTVYLPRHVGTIGQALTDSPAKPSRIGRRETILLVEDERAILTLTTMMLERLGYVILAAHTPGEAVRVAREYTGEIHVLMTDVVMPEMNGKELATIVQSLHPQIEQLFMSGYTSDVIAHHGVLEDGVHFIHKPFSSAELDAKVREVLERGPEG